MAGRAMNVRPLIAALAGSLALALGACAPDAASSTAEPPLAGARIGGPFTLTDHNGRTVRDTDFTGRWRIVYFGYSFCPDVCPTGLQNLGAGLRAFERADPVRGAKVVPIFITVDPARDTPAALKPFVAAFHPRLVGLTGPEAQVRAVAKSYGVYAARGASQPGGGYLVDHSDQAYLMDPAGKPVALLSSHGPPQKVADELAEWVR